MIITKSLRKKLDILLPSDYRKLVVERLAKRGIKIHPNTVYNVLNGDNNLEVANEIISLANEQKELHRQWDKNLKQLSAA